MGVERGYRHGREIEPVRRRTSAAVRGWMAQSLELALRTFISEGWSRPTLQARDVEQWLRTGCTSVHWELALVRRVYVAALQVEGDMPAAEPLARAPG
jgi:hypothetical protein